MSLERIYSLLLDCIQIEQVKELGFDCPIKKDIYCFRKQDVELDITCFLPNKSRGDQKFNYQGYNNSEI